MSLRLTKLALPMFVSCSLFACVAPTGDEPIGSGSAELVGNSPLEPAILLERNECNTDMIPTYKLMVQKAVAAALKGADLSRNGNGSDAFDYRASFPAPGVAPSYPWADVVCRGDKMIVGAWLQPLGVNGYYDNMTKRRELLGSMSVLSTGEAWGLRATDSGIRTLVGYAFADIPKRMNGAGKADAAGDLKLTSMVPSYPTANALQINVGGTYDGVFSVTGFNVALRDSLTINQSQWLDCKSTHTVTLSTTIDSVLNTIFNVSGDLSNQLGLFLSRGPLCIALDSVDQDTYLAGTQGKIQLQVQRTAMSSSLGAVVAGLAPFVARQPTVSIGGDFSVVLEPGDDVPTLPFTARVDDLRAPLTYQWTSSGATFTNKVGNSVDATWSIGTGLTTYKTLTVKVTDADGISATQSRTVTFKRLTSTL